MRGAVHRQVLGDLARDPALRGLEIRLRRGDQALRAVALRARASAVVRAASRRRGDTRASAASATVMPSAFANASTSASGGSALSWRFLSGSSASKRSTSAVSCHQHARAEVDDVRALVRGPRLLVELAANAALFVAARLVELLLGVVHCRPRPDRRGPASRSGRRPIRECRPPRRRRPIQRASAMVTDGKSGGGVEPVTTLMGHGRLTGLPARRRPSRALKPRWRGWSS